MKKIGIITIYDTNNYGNRLQNYALQQVLKNIGCSPETIKNWRKLNGYSSKKREFLSKIRLKLISIKRIAKSIKNIKRYNHFRRFNKNIKFSHKSISYQNAVTFDDKYDYFIVGSDQVWNPNYALSDIDLLFFAKENKRISYAASFGISELPEKYKEKIKNELSRFKAISVRETEGKNIIKTITGRKDIEVCIDPTMLLEKEEWDRITQKPKVINENSKYILNYFLGTLSEERKEEIRRIAKENNWALINILDKNDPFYSCGPSEFLWLEEHAKLVCTDSFHSSVFAILFDTPFVVFNRENEENNENNMNSRIETLLNTLKLNNRYVEKRIPKELLSTNYSNNKKVLNKERKKAILFLKKALENDK